MRRFGRALFWLCDAVIIAACVCGYLAAYVHPATLWWLQPFAIVLPYLAVGMVVLTIVTLVRPWPWARAVHIGLLLLLTARFAPGWVGQAKAPATASTFSVYVFNTLNGAYVDSAGVAIKAQVGEHEPDLLALQEAWLRPREVTTYSTFLSPLWDDGFTVTPPSTGRMTVKLPLLSKHSVQDYEEHQVLYQAESDLAFSLGRGVVQLAGRSLVVYNVHLRSHGEEKPWHADAPAWLSLEFWRPYLRRIKQDYALRAQQAERIKERMQAEEHPVLLVGDFNSPTHDWVYHHLAKGMTDAFRAAGRGWGGTYHREVPFVRIDHVLLSPELVPIRAEVLPALFSDHLPQIVEVAWADAEDSAKTDER